jgi:hypothetical protein
MERASMKLQTFVADTKMDEVFEPFKPAVETQRADVADGADDADSGSKSASTKQADKLMELADGLTLFHTADNTSFADIEINGHRETWSIKSGEFRSWLEHLYYTSEKSVPGEAALKSAISQFSARARFDGAECKVFLRVASHDGKIYFDLADKDWRVVEIDRHGWRIITKSPVRFRRANGMLPAAPPEVGGDIGALRSFLNVRHDECILAACWLLGALRAEGPYPLLVVSGEHGSAKSGLVKLLKMLIDPGEPVLRSLPKAGQDLFVSAKNSYVLAFDNVSKLNDWLSDDLCRLSTGGGFAARQLYSDDQESLIQAVRPILMNGIDEMVKRADLADRVIWLTLRSIPPDQRRTEAEINEAFEANKSKILGALFDGLSEGLRRFDDVHLESLPRMADFTKWAVACETAYWEKGTFLKVISRVRAETVEKIIDSDVVATTVLIFMTGKDKWEGSATDLLVELTKKLGDEGKDRDWPRSPAKLSGALLRISPFLREIGLDFKRRKDGHRRNRIITLAWISGSDTAAKHAPVPPAAPASDWDQIKSQEAELIGYGAGDADDADDLAA